MIKFYQNNLFILLYIIYVCLKKYGYKINQHIFTMHKERKMKRARDRTKMSSFSEFPVVVFRDFTLHFNRHCCCFFCWAITQEEEKKIDRSYKSVHHTFKASNLASIWFLFFFLGVDNQLCIRIKFPFFVLFHFKKEWKEKK